MLCIRSKERDYKCRKKRVGVFGIDVRSEPSLARAPGEARPVPGKKCFLLCFVFFLVFWLLFIVFLL